MTGRMSNYENDFGRSVCALEHSRRREKAVMEREEEREKSCLGSGTRSWK